MRHQFYVIVAVFKHTSHVKDEIIFHLHFKKTTTWQCLIAFWFDLILKWWCSSLSTEMITGGECVRFSDRSVFSSHAWFWCSWRIRPGFFFSPLKISRLKRLSAGLCWCTGSSTGFLQEEKKKKEEENQSDHSTACSRVLVSLRKPTLQRVNL